jgi:hypothetical protein
MGLACMYAGYCFANYGAYLIATKWALLSTPKMGLSLFNTSLIWMSLLNQCLTTLTIFIIGMYRMRYKNVFQAVHL